MNSHRTIVVADHHKSVFVCQVLDRETGEVERRSLASTRAELEPFFRGLQGPVLVFVEACRSWEWVSDLCESLEHEFALVNPRDMPEIARSTKKTDQADVEAMVRRLMVEGDLPRAHRANRSEREQRALTRQLSELRKTRRRTLVQIHAVIDSHGMPSKKTEFGKAAWRESMKAALSEDAWLVLKVLLLQLDQTDSLRDLVDRRINERVSKTEEFRRLKTIPGVGPAIAAVILAEAPDIKRFKSARHFASYCGIVPRVRSSAGKAKHGQITRSGPSDLRWAIGHAILAGLRCKEPSEAVRMYRRKKAKRKPPKVALCAAANKLARTIWAMLVREEDYAKA